MIIEFQSLGSAKTHANTCSGLFLLSFRILGVKDQSNMKSERLRHGGMPLAVPWSAKVRYPLILYSLFYNRFLR
jgi:hypothetical protein